MEINKILAESDLQKLDAKLDSEVASLALLSCERAASLMAILNAFEGFIGTQPPDDRLAEHAAIHAINGLNFAAAWCLRHCPAGDGTFQPAPALLEKAQMCLRSAMEYSKVFDILSLLWRKVVVGVPEAADIVRVRLADPDSQRVLIAGRIMDSASSPASREAIEAAQMPTPEFQRLARPRKTGRSRMKYDISSELYNRIASQQERVLRNMWELDDHWDLDGYTVGEFRRFWVALTAISWIHIYACSNFGTHTEIRDSLIMYARRDRWCRQLAHLSGLSEGQICAIVADLEFCVPPNMMNGYRPELNCQPFVQLTAEVLGVSSWLIVLTNGEAALWHLISVLRPRLHARLRNLKEDFWLNSLKAEFTVYGLESFSRLSFVYGGQSGDLDLLIVDRQRKLAIASQLKWLKPPEHVRDRFYNDNELMIGMRQAHLSHRWLEANREEVASRTGLEVSVMKQIQFMSVVLSKNTLGSGWLPDEVPVLNETLLRIVLGPPHRKDLRVLYLVAKEKRYLPKPGLHFEWDELKARFGGIAFVCNGLGVRLLQHWSPITDIDFTGLDATAR